MKKWMFVIFPGILLLIFLFFYHQTTAEVTAREEAQATEVARQKAADAAHQKMIEDKAREDAAKRAADQAAEDAAKEAEAAAKQKAEMDKIQGETATYRADADKYSKQASELEIQLDALHREKEANNREDFDLEKRVELARVNQRTAEMEIQRLVAMIVTHTDQSYLTRLPPPPAPARAQ